MRNPLPLPVERAIGVGLLLGLGVLWWSSLLARAKESGAADVQIRTAAADAREAHREVAYYAARYAEAVDTVAALRATLARLAAAGAGDTAWIHDTVLVGGEPRIAVPLATLARMDSTRRACGALASSVVPLTTACDSSLAAAHRETAAQHEWGAGWQQKYAAVRPRWYDRLSAGAGYGICADGTSVHTGAVVALTWRIFR